MKDKKKTSREIIEGINTAMKYEAVFNKKAAIIPSFPSGSLALDDIIGIGGYPIGRQIEIAGAPSVGKSHLAAAAIIEIQKKGGQGAYIDTESSLDLKRFSDLGMDVDNLITSTPDYLEQGLDIMQMLIPDCDIIIFDSIGNSTPKSVYEGTAEDNSIGLLAKKLTQEGPKISRLSVKHNCTILWLNQKREQILGSGPRVADHNMTPGGQNIRHQFSLRISVKKTADITGNLGHVITATTVKNKVGPPRKTTEIHFLYESGVCNEWYVINLAVEKGVLQKAGHYVKDGKKTLGNGELNVVKYLMQDKDYYNELLKKLNL